MPRLPAWYCQIRSTGTSFHSLEVVRPLAHTPFFLRSTSAKEKARKPQTKYYCSLDGDSDSPSSKFRIKTATTPTKYWSAREGACNENSDAVSLLGEDYLKSIKSKATTFETQNLEYSNNKFWTQFVLPDRKAKGSCGKVESAYAWASPDALKEGHLGVVGINDVDLDGDGFDLTQFRVYPVDSKDTGCEGPVIIRSKKDKQYLGVSDEFDFQLTKNPRKAQEFRLEFKNFGPE